MNRKDHRHLDLLCDIGDLAAVLTGSNNIASFLRQTVELVSGHMDADGCSIYLLDEGTEELVLEATVGLNPTAVGRVRMKIGDGLVGAVLENLAPLNDGLASRNPRFKYFEEAEEDRFDSFLGVPILRGAEKIGVLVVQHEKRDYFDDIDVFALRAIASQLAGVVGNARFVMDLSRPKDGRRKRRSLKNRVRLVKGTAVSSGYALAPSTILNKSQVGWKDVDFNADQELTPNDFHRAIDVTVDQIRKMQARFSERLPESASLIFTAHIMILKDNRFVKEIQKRIEDFVQYMLAADRSNNTVADYYQPWHPAVLRGLAQIASSAMQVGKELSVCGELAHEIDYIPFLLGIGIRVFSVYPKFLPLIQKEVAKLKINDEELYAGELLGQPTINGVREVIAKRKENQHGT